MVWARLLYLDIKSGIKASKVKGVWQGAAISGRWKNTVRKEFLKAGVPWTYEPEKDDSLNPRHKMPKRPKYVRNHPQRLSEIKALVDKNDKMVAEFRQESLNNRKYKGPARFMKEFVPSWLSYLKTADRKSLSGSEPVIKDNPNIGIIDHSQGRSKKKTKN